MAAPEPLDVSEVSRLLRAWVLASRVSRRAARAYAVAADGSERFYRTVESLLHRHAPRVLALRLPADECALGQLLFGRDQVARLLLLRHKDAVSAVLLALAAQWSGDHPPRE